MMQQGRTESFNLLEYQQRARETCSPKKLYELWQEVCKLYDRHVIGSYHLEEMKEVIMPSLHVLSAIQRLVDQH